MTDLLSERLHETTDRLPVALASADTVRRDARRYARRRNGAVAAAAAASLVVVVGISAGLAGERDADPPPAEPAAVTIDRGRFLTPSDLTTMRPFTEWTGADVSRDMVGQPFCVSMSNGDPVASRLVEFRSGNPGVRGYQLIAAYPSVTLARAAASAARDDLDRCVQRMAPTQSVEHQRHDPGGSGFHVLRSETPRPTAELTVYGWSGRLASVVWLVADDPTPVASKEPENVLNRMLTRVDGGVPDELASALLGAEDIGGGSARQDDTSEQFDENPAAYRPLHLCGYSNRGGQMLHRTFGGADGQQVAGQRVEIAIDSEAATNTYLTIVQDIDRCDGEPDHGEGLVKARTTVDLGGLGDDAVAWRYRVTTAIQTTLVTYVAVVRVGSVLTEVVLSGREEAGLDPGAPAFVFTVEKALTRIRAALPEASAG